MAPQSEYDTLTMEAQPVEVPKGRSGKAIIVVAMLVAAGCVGYFATSQTTPAAVADVADVSESCNLECLNGWPDADQPAETASNMCEGCDPGFYLSGTTCNAYQGACENGATEPTPNADFDCQENNCNPGYYWWANGAQGVCTGYAGDCPNGWLDGQASRDGENDCGGCSNGYHIEYDGGYYINYSGNQGYCTAYGGSCSNGALMEPANTRIANNYCGSCNAGYYLSHGHCYAYGGSCSNGQLASQTDRVQENHCGSCNDGYTLADGTSCQTFSGTCANGNIMPQTSRRQENHCASCDAGFSLDSAASPPSPSRSLAASSRSRSGRPPTSGPPTGRWAAGLPTPTSSAASRASRRPCGRRSTSTRR